MSDIDPTESNEEHRQRPGNAFDDDDLPPRDKTPSSTTVGLVAWGCLLPSACFSIALAFTLLNDGSMPIGTSAIPVGTSLLLLFVMIRLLSKRTRQILIAAFVIAIGFWLLLFGLCVSSISKL